MADQTIGGILVNIGADISELKKASDAAVDELNEIKKGLEQISKTPVDVDTDNLKKHLGAANAQIEQLKAPAKIVVDADAEPLRREFDTAVDAIRNLGPAGQKAAAALDAAFRNVSLSAVAKDATALRLVLAKMAGAAVGTGAAVAVGALGVALVRAGIDGQRSLALLRRETGLTGEALAALDEIADRVGESAGSIDGTAVAQALSQIVRSLDQAGPAAENTLRQFVDLAQATGTDLAQATELAIRLFRGFNVEADQQRATLDTLLRITQQTGVSYGQLASTLASVGPELRALGFGLEESAALIALIEEAGGDADTALSALRIQLKLAADAGQAPRDAFEAIVASIRDAGSEATRNARAFDAFGKSGLDIAEAIDKGAFSVDGFLKKIDAMPETLARASTESRTFSDAVAELKTALGNELEPAGQDVVDFSQVLVDLAKQAVPSMNSVGRTILPTGALAKDAAAGFAILVKQLGLVEPESGKAAAGMKKTADALATTGDAAAKAKATLAGITIPAAVQKQVDAIGASFAKTVGEIDTRAKVLGAAFDPLDQAKSKFDAAVKQLSDLRSAFTNTAGGADLLRDAEIEVGRAADALKLEQTAAGLRKVGDAVKAIELQSATAGLTDVEAEAARVGAAIRKIGEDAGLSATDIEAQLGVALDAVRERFRAIEEKKLGEFIDKTALDASLIGLTTLEREVLTAQAQFAEMGKQAGKSMREIAIEAERLRGVITVKVQAQGAKEVADDLKTIEDRIKFLKVETNKEEEFKFAEDMREKLLALGFTAEEAAAQIAKVPGAFEKLRSAEVADILQDVTERLAAADEKARVFGTGFDAAASKSQTLTNAIQQLIDRGLTQADPAVQSLVDKLRQVSPAAADAAAGIKKTEDAAKAAATEMLNFESQLIGKDAITLQGDAASGADLLKQARDFAAQVRAAVDEGSAEQLRGLQSAVQDFLANYQDGLRLVGDKASQEAVRTFEVLEQQIARIVGGLPGLSGISDLQAITGARPLGGGVDFDDDRIVTRLAEQNSLTRETNDRLAEQARATGGIASALASGNYSADLARNQQRASFFGGSSR